MLLGLIAPTAGHIQLLGRPLPDPRTVSRTRVDDRGAGFLPVTDGAAEPPGDGVGRRRARRRRRPPGGSEGAGREVRTLAPGPAAALPAPPPLLILEEPTNGLDPAG